MKGVVRRMLIAEDKNSDKQSNNIGKIVNRAIAAWNIKNYKYDLIKNRENCVFSVTTPEGNKNALRIHRYGYHSNTAVESELNWLSALHGSGIAVPKVIPTKKGNTFTNVIFEGEAYPRQVDMISWLPGKPLGSIEQGLNPEIRDIGETFFEVGRTVAKLHNHASIWQPPQEFMRHSWDIDGLTGDTPLWGKFWEFPGLNGSQKSLLKRARNTSRIHLNEVGQSDSIFGLIHADCNLDNLLLNNGNVMVIDFDDCGFGWHLFDLSTISILFHNTEYFDVVWNAVIRGYRMERTLSDHALQLMPLFFLLRAFTYVGWIYTRSETQSAKVITPKIVSLTCSLAEDYLKFRHNY